MDRAGYSTKATLAGDVYETELIALSDLPRLLSVLDAICAACAGFAP